VRRGLRRPTILRRVNNGRNRLLLAVGVTIGVGGALILAAGLFAALPVLLAFLPLLAGHYIGASRLERAIVARTVRSRPTSTPRPRLAPRALAPRGGRLIAESLAERGPPPAAVPALA
jgi:hypothetical protein